MNDAKQARRAPENRTSRFTTPRDAALCAVRDVEENGAYVSQALDRALSASKLSDNDRRLCAALVYTCVENRLRIDYALSRYVKTKPDGVVAGIMSIAAAQLLYMDRIPSHAAVNEAVEQARRWKRSDQTGFVNACLRGMIRDRDGGVPFLPEGGDGAARDSIRYSFSEDAVRALTNAYGEDEARLIMGYAPASRSAVTVRANASMTPPGGFEAYLDKCGLKWTRASVPGCYHIENARDVESLEGYRRGILTVQGESSALAAMACACRPGMTVLDACAAPGGKTCLMAEAMQGTGRVYAWDVRDARCDLIRHAARRMKLDNIRVMTHDATADYPDFRGAMDAVLVDAPCTGLGVAYEKPDIKYTLTRAKIDELTILQTRILDACADHVKPGGLLVYSTCSLLPEENTAQMDAFLAGHPEFEPLEDPSFLPEELRRYYQDGRIQILPHRDGMDGFFIGRMRRRRDRR